MNPNELEAELKTRTTAPRVTLEALEDNIAKIDYYVHTDSCLTICILTLVNGFNVIGESACADPANFRQDIGEKIALDNAKKKIWPLMGYALKQELYEQSAKGLGDTFLDRMKNEASELESKVIKLNAFVKGNVHFKDLHSSQQTMLEDQLEHMTKYLDILTNRIYTNS